MIPLPSGTRFGGDARPAPMRSPSQQNQAISFAAYRALVDLFPQPQEVAIFDAQMAASATTRPIPPTTPATPTGIGNLCAEDVLDFRPRWRNSSNGYTDTTGYPGAFTDYTGRPLPVNTPELIIDPNRWQPLRVSDGHGGFVVQTYIGPLWGLVTPFALTAGSQFRPTVGPVPRRPGTTPAPDYLAQAQQILNYSANLTDPQKMIAEYLADGPSSELPPGHWCLFTQFVSHATGTTWTTMRRSSSP